MSIKKIDALLIPTTDPHQSEYIPDYWKIRAWLTGFTGSAGTAVITKNHAGLWTDSRYFVQAEKELTAPFILHKLKTRSPEYLDWLTDNLQSGDSIGIDTQLFSVAEFENLSNTLNNSLIKIIPIGDIFNKLWKERPQLTNNTIFLHDPVYAGSSRIEKIKKVQDFLTTKKASLFILSALDEIAWLLNIRGTDIDFNPVVSSYCIITLQNVTLFINEAKLSPVIKETLNNDGIAVKEYHAISEALSQLNSKFSVICDKTTLNYALYSEIPANVEVIDEKSIISYLKACKNTVEITNYYNAQIRDGVAMCKFLYWLENSSCKNRIITELDAAKKVEEYRKEQHNYVGPSFNPISAYQENAALPHYSANEKNNQQLKAHGIYLIDSGGQYLDGTTDITRTISMGNATEAEKLHFTLVLKGHIRLATVKFPVGTKGFHLDTLARLDLWNQGLDFGHGTGHGIGYFLNVHEGPQGFSQSSIGNGNSIIEPGMFITNEPGLYLEGSYGIRIENVMVCKKDASTGFLYFDTVTYCPIDKQLINRKLLSPIECEWLNSYHNQVYKLLNNHLPVEIKEWLKDKTLPIT